MSPLTGVLREAWAMYRRFAAHFLLIAFLFYLISGVIGALLSLAGAGGSLAAALINFLVLCLLEATLVKAVQDVRDGRVDLTFTETLRAALPFLLPVFGAAILFVIAVTIGFVLIIVPGLILLTFWSLFVPCIVLGGVPAMSSFGQSWRTVRGHAWNVFGTYVLVWLIWIVFEIVLGLIFSVLPGAGRSFIASVVAGTLVAPFIATVVTLIWYRLTAAHQNQGPPPGYPPPGYGEPPYPQSGYGTQPGYGNQGYPPPPGNYGSAPGPGSYGGPGGTGPAGPGEPAGPTSWPGETAGPTGTDDPWGNATRPDNPPNGNYTRPDNQPPS